MFDFHWRTHPFCFMLGFASTVCIEVSVLTSFIVAADRHHAITRDVLMSGIDSLSVSKRLITSFILWTVSSLIRRDCLCLRFYYSQYAEQCLYFL